MIEPRIYRAAFVPALFAFMLAMFSLGGRPAPLPQSGAADVLGASAAPGAAHERAVLDSLHAGSVTLGAHYCSRVIDGMRYQPHAIFLRDGLEEMERCAALLGERAAMVRRGW